MAEYPVEILRKPGAEDDARQWDLICTAIRAIETAVPLPDLI